MSLFDWLFRSPDSRHGDPCTCIACCDCDRPYDDESMFRPQEVPAPAAQAAINRLQATDTGTEARIAAAIERLRTIDAHCLALIAERIRCTVVRTDHQDESIAILCRVQDELHAAASDAIKLLEGGKQ